MAPCCSVPPAWCNCRAVWCAESQNFPRLSALLSYLLVLVQGRCFRKRGVGRRGWGRGGGRPAARTWDGSQSGLRTFLLRSVREGQVATTLLGHTKESMRNISYIFQSTDSYRKTLWFFSFFLKIKTCSTIKKPNVFRKTQSGKSASLWRSCLLPPSPYESTLRVGKRRSSRNLH